MLVIEECDENVRRLVLLHNMFVQPKSVSAMCKDDTKSMFLKPKIVVDNELPESIPSNCPRSFMFQVICLYFIFII